MLVLYFYVNCGRKADGRGPIEENGGVIRWRYLTRYSDEDYVLEENMLVNV